MTDGLTEYEKQMIRLEKAKLLIALAAIEQKQRAAARANRSAWEKVEDFLFDW